MNLLKAYKWMEQDHNNTTDMLDDFAELYAVSFGIWLGINTESHSKDGWCVYKKEWLTITECYRIFLDSNQADA